MRLHLLAFPHTRVTPEYATCAYTQKIVKFLKMLPPGSGYEIVLYAPAGSDARGHELVEILTDEERVSIFGPDDPNSLPAWPGEEQTALFNARAAVEIRRRVGDRDLLLMTMGASQMPVHEALSDLIGADRRMLAVEPGVGYEGWFTNYVAFESYAWMHWLYAKREWQLQTSDATRGQVQDGRAFDAVIPNYFDRDDFPLERRPGSYLLFLGRLINRKGLVEAAAIAEEMGQTLVVAGPGAAEHRRGYLRSAEGGGPVLTYDGVEYVGVADVATRAELLSEAAALLAPTRYIEPFGGVAVEAMMAGCPVVATDWGAFTETVAEGISGYRFRTLSEGCDAVERAEELDPKLVRAYAHGRYSLEAVAPMFDRWLRRVETLWGDGWYARPGTSRIAA